MVVYSFAFEWGKFGTYKGEFKHPWDIATGSQGQVFVADADNNRIQRFDKYGSYQLSFGRGQNPSYTLIHNELLTPVGICLDEDKNEIYVTDDHRRVLVFDTNGNFLRNWQDHILGGRGLAINPIDINSIFVVNTSLSSIEVYDTKGYKKFRWGQQGNGNNDLDRPNSIAFDSQGYLFVTDTNNHRIMKFKDDATYAGQWGTFGTGKDEFTFPLGITIDLDDNVYVTDSEGIVRIFDNTGNYITSFGSIGAGQGQFNGPSGIDTIKGMSIYIADKINHRIQVFEL